jgi:hypothetical protein
MSEMQALAILPEWLLLAGLCRGAPILMAIDFAVPIKGRRLPLPGNAEHWEISHGIH